MLSGVNRRKNAAPFFKGRSGKFLEEFLDAEEENGSAAGEKMRQGRCEPRISAQEKPPPEPPRDEGHQGKS